MSLYLPSTKFVTTTRTVSGTVVVEDSDVVLDCDTTSAPVTIDLKLIPADYWSKLYRLYIKDASSNAASHNITITAPAGCLINGASTLVISTNRAVALIRISSNTDYLCTVGATVAPTPTILTVTDTGTVDLTLTPISGGYNLQANTVLNDSVTAYKLLTATNTSYCKRTDQYGTQLLYNTPVGSFTVGETITGGTSGATAVVVSSSYYAPTAVGVLQYSTLVGLFTMGETITGTTSAATAVLISVGKYENPFQSVTDGSIFAAYTAKTELGALVNSFNLTTGVFTAPSAGWYYIQCSFGYSLNSSPYLFYSDNTNTLGQSWMLGTSVGSFSVTNYLAGSGLLSVGLVTLTKNSSQLYVFSNVLSKLSAGQQISIVYTNNSDLEMFGQNNSSVQFKAVRLGN